MRHRQGEGRNGVAQQTRSSFTHCKKKEQCYKREQEAQAEIERREQEIADLTIKLGNHTVITPKQQQKEDISRHEQLQQSASFLSL